MDSLFTVLAGDAKWEFYFSTLALCSRPLLQVFQQLITCHRLEVGIVVLLSVEAESARALLRHQLRQVACQTDVAIGALIFPQSFLMVFMSQMGYQQLD